MLGTGLKETVLIGAITFVLLLFCTKRLKRRHARMIAPSVPYDVVNNLMEGIGFRFRDENLLIRAVFGDVFVKTVGVRRERLAFLGDSLLSVVVKIWIFSERPNASEGELTEVCSNLCSTHSCVLYGEEMKLYEHFQNSNTNFGERWYATIFESVIGAIYSETDLIFTQKFILKKLEHVFRQVLLFDPYGAKNKLTKLLGCQIDNHTFKIEEEQGTGKVFRATLTLPIDGRSFTGKWCAKKKMAELDAANVALNAVENSLPRNTMTIKVTNNKGSNHIPEQFVCPPNPVGWLFEHNPGISKQIFSTAEEKNGEHSIFQTTITMPNGNTHTGEWCAKKKLAEASAAKIALKFYYETWV